MEQYGAGFRLWYLPDLKNSEGGARQEKVRVSAIKFDKVSFLRLLVV